MSPPLQMLYTKPSAMMIHRLVNVLSSHLARVVSIQDIRFVCVHVSEEQTGLPCRISVLCIYLEIYLPFLDLERGVSCVLQFTTIKSLATWLEVDSIVSHEASLIAWFLTAT